MHLIQHSKPWIIKDDIDAVDKNLMTSLVSNGEATQNLEKKIAAMTGGGDAVALGSGTAALLLALLAVGVGEGDEVIIPTYVCRSIFDAIRSLGATPILCDVGQDWVLTEAEIREVLSPKIKAIVAPHLFGIRIDIDAICKFGLPVIEDCSQGFVVGEKAKNKADIKVISMHATKCLTSGEGGLAISQDNSLVKKMNELRYKIPDLGRQHYFSKLSDLCSTLALSQLERYDDALAIRKKIAQKYIKGAQEACFEALNISALEKSMFYRFPVLINGNIDGCINNFDQHKIRISRGLDALLHRIHGVDDRYFPVASRLFDKTVSLPIYPGLSKVEQVRCLAAIKKILPIYVK